MCLSVKPIVYLLMYRKAWHAEGKREVASAFMADLQEHPGGLFLSSVPGEACAKGLGFPHRKEYFMCLVVCGRSCVFP